MKLYELDQEIAQIEAIVDIHLRETQGDIDSVPVKYGELLCQLSGERKQKLLNLGSWHKSVEPEVGAYTNEIKILQHKKKVAENKAKWLSGFIRSFLSPSEKIKDARVSLSWRKSEKLSYSNDFDARNLPIVYQKVSYDVNGTELKKALKLGEKFKDVELKPFDNLQIK